MEEISKANADLIPFFQNINFTPEFLFDLNSCQERLAVLGTTCIVLCSLK